MKSTIRYKFNMAVGIPGPKGELLTPKIYNKSIKNPITGQPHGAAVQEYNYNEEYSVDLLEEEKELPSHISALGPEIRAAFVQTFAKELSDNHTANQAFRKSFKYYESQGYITILSDSFIDNQKEHLNEASKETVSPPSTKKTERKKAQVSSS